MDPYYPYNHWPYQHTELQSTQPRTETEKPCEDTCKRQILESERDNVNNYTESENMYEQPTAMTSSVRPTLCMNFIPQSTPIEMYSPMVPLPPGTPVIYSPPIDMQYISSPQFVYPPTPPAAWYPTGVNSHGFIFPRPQ